MLHGIIDHRQLEKCRTIPWQGRPSRSPGPAPFRRVGVEATEPNGRLFTTECRLLGWGVGEIRTVDTRSYHIMGADAISVPSLQTLKREKEAGRQSTKAQAVRMSVSSYGRPNHYLNSRDSPIMTGRSTMKTAYNPITIPIIFTPNSVKCCHVPMPNLSLCTSNRTVSFFIKSPHIAITISLFTLPLGHPEYPLHKW